MVEQERLRKSISRCLLTGNEDGTRSELVERFRVLSQDTDMGLMGASTGWERKMAWDILASLSKEQRVALETWRDSNI